MSQPGTIGRLSQVIDRWIYTGCLCFGLNIDEQKQSGFRYDYSIYQVEYSRNLLFASGAVMDRLFNTVVDRTRSRLDVPKAMVDRFTTMLDCVELGFLPDGILDQLPAPSQLRRTRVGGIDMNVPRARASLAAALALAVAPQGFTVARSPPKCAR